MSRVIEKKALSQYFNHVLNGEKTFDLRLADWKCEQGDILVLREVDKNGNYTGRELRKKVGFVLKTKDLKLFPNEDVDEYGYQIISLLDGIKK